MSNQFPTKCPACLREISVHSVPDFIDCISTHDFKAYCVNMSVSDFIDCIKKVFDKLENSRNSTSKQEAQSKQ